MICEMCDTEMILTNQFFYGKLNSNIHYECVKCPTTCVEHIRLGVPYREIWRYKNIKEWEVERG